MDRSTPFLAALLSALCCLASAAAPESLFSRLGGTAKVTAFVDATVDELAKTHDGGALGNQDVQAIKNELVARICFMTGGGCRQPSATRVGVAGSTDAAQSELVGALRVAMRAQHVPLAARNELIEVIAPLGHDLASR